MQDSLKSVFVYGTLMHPSILKRVIGNDGTHLRACPAVLSEFTRHRIKGVDYPGILPYSQSKQLFNRNLSPEERCVRGTLVTGFTVEDMRLLDDFENDVYTRQRVLVRPLGPFAVLLDTPVQCSLDALAMSTTVDCESYVWTGSTSLVSGELWSYDEFMNHHVGKWVGPGSESNYYFEEFERRQVE